MQTLSISNSRAFDPRAITAVILAGGANTRMNLQPKACIEWRGQRFIDHIIARLRDQAATIAISSNQPELFESLALPLLPDFFTDRRGPLAGILAGLHFSQTEFTLFVPCDTPLVSLQLGARLHQAMITNDADIAYASTGADQHYLFALMRSNLTEQLREYFTREDYAVRRWFATRAQIAVPFDDEPGGFLNINTPQALQQLNDMYVEILPQTKSQP
jgi:molybdenum cofactor guanylyltransferase